jgi:hypothetical protein
MGDLPLEEFFESWSQASQSADISTTQWIIANRKKNIHNARKTNNNNNNNMTKPTHN